MNNIQVGDLVMVVKPDFCCGDNSFIGATFFVKKITLGIGCNCAQCGAPAESLIAWEHNLLGHDIRVLKKIDPEKSNEKEKEIECTIK